MDIVERRLKIKGTALYEEIHGEEAKLEIMPHIRCSQSVP
jgi:hypothetical protein